MSSTASSPAGTNKKSKLLSLAASRLKAVRSGRKTPENDVHEGVEVEPPQPETSQAFSRPPFLGIAEPDMSDWDSEKYNDDLIAIPRLSTITERDEISSRHHGVGGSKLGAMSLTRGHSVKRSVDVPLSVSSQILPARYPTVTGSVHTTPSIIKSDSNMHAPSPKERVSDLTSSAPSVAGPRRLSGFSSVTISDGSYRSGSDASTEAQDKNRVKTAKAASSTPRHTTHLVSEPAMSDGWMVPDAEESDSHRNPSVPPRDSTTSTATSLHFGSPTDSLPSSVRKSSLSMSSLGTVQPRRAESKNSIVLNEVIAHSTSKQPSIGLSSSDKSSQSINPMTAIERKPSSKLAQLAQTRIRRNEPANSNVQSSHTEILDVAIPRGVFSQRSSTLTTAITTSYQTLDSLNPMPPSAPNPASKLRLKAQRIQLEHKHPPAQIQEPEISVEELPMFSPTFAASTPMSSIRLAAPSSFATLLIRDDVPTSSPPRPQAAMGWHAEAEAPTTTSSSRGFAFDSPSPDDVVINARKGTALRRPTAKTTR